ncbi:hypothetical protein PHYBOEH_009631 [Phytophthora boehmeriae]|uniref:RxLR effector protein n=1 Tax=Phytophthora boehmeriae TaxID=109152 RepID=A0A8T1VX85_9STRA|nr:hypothetical protein PHYBOEH_009631 [Phytophthora boehmeriae]
MIQLGGSSVSHELTGNRFLRSDKEKNKEEDEAAADDEERIVNKLRGALGLYNPKLKTSTFDTMIADDVIKAEVFAKWDKFDVPLKTITRSMNPSRNKRFQSIYNEYVIRRRIMKKQITPDGVRAELKATFEYMLADTATKKEADEIVENLIKAALQGIKNKP